LKLLGDSSLRFAQNLTIEGSQYRNNVIKKTCKTDKIVL